jgi:predicted RNA polymerase sigma factor
VLGDTLARLGRTEEARKAWETALALSRKLEPGAQAEFVPRLEAKLKK